MELRVLKYFLMIAREENITKAAGLLHVSQPSLSRQMMQLEEELDVKLFRRSKHSIALTEDGMLLKRRAQEIVSLAEKTKADFTNRKEEIAGVIAIGSGEFHASQFLFSSLSSFHKRYPQVRYEIYSGHSDNIKERLENGLLDFGLLLEPVDVSRYEFMRMPVKEEWGVFVSEQSELADRDRISPVDLAHRSLLVTQREMIQNEILNWLGEYAEQIEILGQGNLLYNLAAMARNHMGIAFNLKRDCDYKGLRFVPLVPKLEAGTVLVWKKMQTLSPAMEAVLTHIKKCVTDIS